MHTNKLFWRSHTSGFDPISLRSLATRTGDGLIVGVGSGYDGSNFYASSTMDCVTWTRATSSFFSGWTNVIYAEALDIFLAYGMASDDGGFHIGWPRIATSSDGGDTWTDVTPAFWKPVFPTSLTSIEITWSPAQSKFVAVAGWQAFSSGIVLPTIATSPTGSTWTDTGFLGFNGGGHHPFGDPKSVAFSPSIPLWCAVGPALATSPDGTTWTARTRPTTPSPSPTQWNGQKIIWVPSLNLFVCYVVNNNSGLVYMYTSANGINFTKRDTPIDSTENFNSYTAIADTSAITGAPKVVAAGNFGAIESDDAINWVKSGGSPFRDGPTSLVALSTLNTVAMCGNFVA